MADPTDITTGELYRLTLSMDKKLDRMHTDMVGRAEYEADQEGVDRRFQDAINKHNELNAEVKEIKAGQAMAEKEQRQNRAKWVFAIVMAVVSPIIGLVLSILIRGGA